MRYPLMRKRSIAGKQSSSAGGRFNRERLPNVADVLARLELKPSRPNGSGYAQVRCPIHGEANPSLSIHLERGNWRCFACGAHGGDALELFRRARGLSFVAAARELGAWEAGQ